ncbi:hypothetical protein LX36DRAFT_754209, partial [Colletotrichum falcatum]
PRRPPAPAAPGHPPAVAAPPQRGTARESQDPRGAARAPVPSPPPLPRLDARVRPHHLRRVHAQIGGAGQRVQCRF